MFPGILACLPLILGILQPILYFSSFKTNAWVALRWAILYVSWGRGDGGVDVQLSYEDNKTIFWWFWDTNYFILGNFALQRLIKTKIQACFAEPLPQRVFWLSFQNPGDLSSECSHTRAVTHVQESRDQLGNSTLSLVDRRAPSSERNWHHDSCDVMAPGSVSWQQPPSLVFLTKQPVLLFHSLKKTKRLILSILKYIMSKRVKRKTTILFSFDRT